MKKFLFALLAVVAVAAACNPEDAKELPAVSFEAALPVISDASATFNITEEREKEIVTLLLKSAVEINRRLSF